MPNIKLNNLTIHYLAHGHGAPLLLLHAGWGLGINGFHYQEKTLSDEFRLIVPDRRGYGRSTHADHFDADFHWQHADDMCALLDRLKIDRTLIWGHSDGAVIGAIMAITQPDRVRGLVFEGGHFYNRKPRSQPLMDPVYRDPMVLPEAARIKLAHYHGEDYWPQVIRNWAGAWLALYQREGDLYRGRLDEIKCPTLIMFGAQDEHTSVNEMEELAKHIPRARLSIYPDGGHSVHDARLTREACTQAAREFFRTIHDLSA